MQYSGIPDSDHDHQHGLPHSKWKYEHDHRFFTDTTNELNSGGAKVRAGRPAQPRKPARRKKNRQAVKGVNTREGGVDMRERGQDAKADGFIDQYGYDVDGTNTLDEKESEEAFLSDIEDVEEDEFLRNISAIEDQLVLDDFGEYFNSSTSFQDVVDLDDAAKGVHANKKNEKLKRYKRNRNWDLDFDDEDIFGADEYLSDDSWSEKFSEKKKKMKEKESVKKRSGVSRLEKLRAKTSKKAIAAVATDAAGAADTQSEMSKNSNQNSKRSKDVTHVVQTTAGNTETAGTAENAAELVWNERGQLVKKSDLTTTGEKPKAAALVKTKQADKQSDKQAGRAGEVTEKTVVVPKMKNPVSNLGPRKAAAPDLGLDPNSPNKKLYLADTPFTCLGLGNKIVKIDHSFVNDNFCDCLDGADEPGTSACAGKSAKQGKLASSETGFFCVHEETYLYTSRINDGICDCCDGSDEWDLHESSVASHCPNLCSKIDQKHQAVVEERKKGQQKRQQYIQEAKNARASDNRFGTDNAFYSLTTAKHGCWNFDADHYRYTMCLFESVKQKKVSGASDDRTVGNEVKLGNTFRWLEKDKTAVLADGDACHGHPARSTTFYFTCAAENRITRVHEDDICAYVVEFETPAACV